MGPHRLLVVETIRRVVPCTLTESVACSSNLDHDANMLLVHLWEAPWLMPRQCSWCASLSKHPRSKSMRHYVIGCIVVSLAPPHGITHIFLGSSQLM